MSLASWTGDSTSLDSCSPKQPCESYGVAWTLRPMPAGGPVGNMMCACSCRHECACLGQSGHIGALGLCTAAGQGAKCRAPMQPGGMFPDW